MITVPALCSPTYSYKVNYQIEALVYQDLVEKTQTTKRVKLPALIALTKSTLLNIITRTAAIGEVVIHGFGLLLSLVFSQKPYLRLKFVFSELSQTPGNIVRVCSIPLELAINLFLILAEPRAFIYIQDECVKVNKAHAEAGTIGSEGHDFDLSMASVQAKARLIRYQEDNEN